MPWKESTSMSSRHEFVLLARQPSANIAELCRAFHISRKTAYKWLERYAAHGLEGLVDHSRRPRTSPASSSDELELQVLALHVEYPYWSGRKLRELLPERLTRPHHSTIDAILKRHGCHVIGAPVKQETASIRFEHELPNSLWQIDFKGHFALTALSAGRCHPLTILDDHSRFSLCLAACSDERYSTVRACMEATFERYGLPDRITADNGPPWGSTGLKGLTKLEVWLIRLGIRVSHSRPYHPQTQGKDERFHRTLKLELLDRRGFGSIAQCQNAFDDWRDQYNTIRPHQALGMQPPAIRYQRSGRTLPQVLQAIEYLSSDAVRKVDAKGYISHAHQRYFIGEGLQSQRVAIRPAAQTDGLLEVYFCHHKVTEIDLRNMP
jgi:transposase InsO family protein